MKIRTVKIIGFSALAIAVAGCATIGIFLVKSGVWREANQKDQRIKKLLSLGVIIDPAKMNAKYQNPSAKEGADFLSKKTIEYSVLWNKVRQGKPEEYSIKQDQEFAQKNQLFLDSMSQALTYPPSGLIIDYSSGDGFKFEIIAKLKSIVRLLCADANLHFRKRNFDNAVHRFAVAGYIAKSIGSNMSMICRLIQLTNQFVINANIANCIRDSGFSDSQLKTLAEIQSQTISDADVLETQILEASWGIQVCMKTDKETFEFFDEEESEEDRRARRLTRFAIVRSAQTSRLALHYTNILEAQTRGKSSSEKEKIFDQLTPKEDFLLDYFTNTIGVINGSSFRQAVEKQKFRTELLNTALTFRQYLNRLKTRNEKFSPESVDISKSVILSVNQNSLVLESQPLKQYFNQQNFKAPSRNYRIELNR